MMGMVTCHHALRAATVEHHLHYFILVAYYFAAVLARLTSGAKES